MATVPTSQQLRTRTKYHQLVEAMHDVLSGNSGAEHIHFSEGAATCRVGGSAEQGTIELNVRVARHSDAAQLRFLGGLCEGVADDIGAAVRSVGGPARVPLENAGLWPDGTEFEATVAVENEGAPRL